MTEAGGGILDGTLSIVDVEEAQQADMGRWWCARPSLKVDDSVDECPPGLAQPLACGEGPKAAAKAETRRLRRAGPRKDNR